MVMSGEVKKKNIDATDSKNKKVKVKMKAGFFRSIEYPLIVTYVHALA
jgi:hypothetical protein